MGIHFSCIALTAVATEDRVLRANQVPETGYGI